MIPKSNLLFVDADEYRLIQRGLISLVTNEPDGEDIDRVIPLAAKLQKMVDYQNAIDQKLAEDTGNTAGLPEAEI